MNARLLLLFCALPLLAPAQQPALPDLSVPAGMVKREFPLGHADLDTVEQLLTDTLSDSGKHHIFKTQRKLLVIDKPENIEAVRQMLPHITQGAPNVKIEFLSRNMSNSQVTGGQVTGTIQGNNGRIIGQGNVNGTPGVFRRTPGGGAVFDSNSGGAIDIDVLNQTTNSSSLNTAFILVRAGKEGFIELTRDVPMVDYFTRYIADGSYGAVFGVQPQLLNNQVLLPLAGGRFEVPEIRWEKAGTRLLVRPIIDGNLIHLEIMPQIRSVVIVEPDALRGGELSQYLTGREQYVTFQGLATTVTVQNGQAVQIGGFSEASDGFNRYIFGGASSQNVSVGNMTVRATIQ